MTEGDREVADDTRRHLRHVARGGALGLVGAGVSAVAGFVLVVIVTRYYPAEEAGLFFTVTSAFLLMTAVTTLGTETGLARFLLRYEAQDRRGDIPPTLRAAFRPTLIYSVVVAAVIVVFAEPLADLIGLGGAEGTASVRVLAVMVPLATWNALTLAGTRAFGRMRATVMVDKIGRPLAQPLLVLLVSHRRGRPARAHHRVGRPLRRRRPRLGVDLPLVPAPQRHLRAHRTDQELPRAQAGVLAVHVAEEHHPRLADGHPAHGHHPDRRHALPQGGRDLHGRDAVRGPGPVRHAGHPAGPAAQVHRAAGRPRGQEPQGGLPDLRGVEHGRRVAALRRRRGGAAGVPRGVRRGVRRRAGWPWSC